MENKLHIEEEPKPYRVEVERQPLGETGDYDSWLELVCPKLNLQCYDPNVEEEELQEIADMLNAYTALTEKHRAELTELKERNDYLENAGYESAFYQNELREFKAKYEPDVCPTCGFKNGEHDNACN